MIPEHLKDEFLGFMRAANDDSLPDGAWWAKLEDAAEEFMRQHKLGDDANGAVLLYLRWSGSIMIPDES